MNQVNKMEDIHYRAMIDSSIHLPTNNLRLRSQLCQMTKSNAIVLLLGSSITAGYSPLNNITHPYPKLVETYLMEQFESTHFEFVNLGYAGIHSLLGLAQIERRIISKQHLQDTSKMQKEEFSFIFLEYATNNVFDMEYAKSFEGLIRKLLIYSPKASIIIICALNKASYTCEPYMTKIADHYSIPVLSITNALSYGKIHGLTWEDYSLDLVHPSPYGHKIIADCVIQLMKTSLLQSSEHNADSKLVLKLTQEVKLPSTWIYGDEFTGARYFDADQIPEENRGEFKPAITHPLFPMGLSCNETSSLPLTLDLLCEKLYILYEQSADPDISGKVSVDITNLSEPIIIDSFSIYAWGNPVMMRLIDGPRQTYSIEIKMLQLQKNTSFKLLGFLYI